MQGSSDHRLSSTARGVTVSIGVLVVVYVHCCMFSYGNCNLLIFKKKKEKVKDRGGGGCRCYDVNRMSLTKRRDVQSRLVRSGVSLPTSV